MDAERWSRLQELFARARAAPDDERVQLLQVIAADDADLAEELRSLLAADATPGPMDDMAQHLAPVSRLVVESVPPRVGPYRIIRELGRGGMGVVYLAERADGQYQQHVAIKLIATAHVDDPLHKRFVAERQILAGLAHPNIARLLDGGHLDDGRPYLVLEYVDGLTITEWCDRQRLDLRARLRLFVDVCTAVQHAHQKLVIHRDLKPNNILVSGDGRVHLLDFGIAKLIDPTLATSLEPATRHELRVMTPEYASPEQVQGAPLSTASDIYSLGVLLYVLLCGRSPYRLTSGSLVELATAVIEQDPERPSMRAARGDIAATERGTAADRLARELAGDLDSIVLMAMRKEPALRYGSADLLRLDIERYLSGRPVTANRGGRRYRIGKFVRRHRVEVGAMTLLLGGLLATLTLALEASRRVSRERDRAELALAQSEGVTDFMMELFRSGDIDDSVTSDALTALDLLRRGTARVNTLSDQPMVQAQLLDVVGQMSLHLGRLDDAQRLLEQSIAVRRRLPRADSTALASGLVHLAWVNRARGDYDRARTLVTEALEIRRRALPPNHPDVAEALYELGWLTGGPSQERLYRQALDILPDTGPAATRRVTLLQAISTSMRRQGRFAEAVSTDREALRVAERAFGPEHAATGNAMIHLADHVRDIEQDLATAERLYRRGLELTARKYGENSLRLLHGLQSLGTLLSGRGEVEAERLFRRAIAIRRTATGPEHPQIADGLQLLAGELARQGRLAEAEGLQRQALAHSVRTLGARHTVVTSSRLPQLGRILALQRRHVEVDTVFEQALTTMSAPLVIQGEVRREYGRLLMRRGEHARAEQQLRDALALIEQHTGRADHPNVHEGKRALMELYQAMGRADLVAQYRVPPGRYVAY